MKFWKKNINQEFEQEIALIKNSDPFKNARIAELENKKQTDIDSLDCLKKKEKRSKKRKIKDTAEIEIENIVKNKRIKTMIDFEKTNVIV